jgi:outer membrane usher protein
LKCLVLMQHQAIALVIVAAALLWLPAVAAGQAIMQPPNSESPDSELHAVRFAARAGGSRLVIETDEPVPFRLLTPGSIRQLRVALVGLDPASLLSAIDDQVPEIHVLIADIKVSRAEPGQALLVIDLHGLTTSTLFNLSPEDGVGHRLVIDLMPVPAAAIPPESTAGLETATVVKAAPPPPINPPVEAATEFLWLEATLNQQRRRHTLLALKDNGNLYLTQGDLHDWGLKLPGTPDLNAHGKKWFALEPLGIKYTFDTARLTLEMTAPPGLFAGNAMTAPGRLVIEPTPAPLGAFFNYDLSSTRAKGQSNTSGLMELGVFNRLGSGTFSAIGRHGAVNDANQFVRLDTAWRRDFHQSRRTLLIGDTLSRGTAFSGGVRFGGLQWGNNFDLQPELVTMPLLSMAGEATLPSTIEVYVNDALRLRQEVEPGPFDIDQIPVVTGPGQVMLVVTDILGRQQVISRDFYASQRLLKPGLHDWNWELGAIRQNYGLENFDYGRAFVAATHRYGLSRRVTAEVHAHLAETHGNLGAGLNWLTPGGGILNVAAAASQGDDADGWLAIAGFQRQGQRFSGGFEAQFASETFTRLGLPEDRSLPERQLRASLSARTSERSNLSLVYTGQVFHDRQDIEFVTLRYSQRLSGAAFINLAAVHYLDSSENALMASLSIPLGQTGARAGLSTSWRTDSQHADLNLTRSLPTGTGFGYNLQVRAGDGDFQRGSLAYQNDFGTWRAEGSHRAGSMTTRAQATGGIAWLGGELFAARHIRDSFAVVHVPGFEGVRVYAENQEIGRTNASGNALVPNLRPYQRNRLRIEQADLPLGARIDGLEIEVAPYWRSGVLVAFPVARTRDAFFRILMDNGEPLPAGAIVYDENGDAWPVGHRGEAFISGLAEINFLHARHNGQRCTFELMVPDSNDPLPDLGQVNCRAATP